MPSAVQPQVDFTAGELDPEVKRDNKSLATQAGVREMTNWRILNAKGAANRSGHRTLFLAADRTEEVGMAPGITYYLNFAAGFMRIFDGNGFEVFSEARPWTVLNLHLVDWAVFDRSIYVVFTGMRPRIYTWDGVVTWSATDYVEQVDGGTHKRTAFYRIAPKGITLALSALTGVVNITFAGGNVLQPGMVGTRIRYQERQLTIASVLTPLTGTATVNEAPIPSNQQAITLNPVSTVPTVGLVVSQIQGLSGLTASGTVVSYVAGPPAIMTVELLTSVRFITTNNIVAPGKVVIGTPTVVADAAPGPTVVWDQEVINDYQGYPQSVFVDQNRLGFANIPSVPAAIMWSAVLNFNDLDPDKFATDGLATDAIFELMPGKRQVFHVVPGMDTSEFVFSDKGLHYIPISASNPLRPGSVAPSLISEDECENVKPRRVGEIIVYVGGGGTDLFVVKIFGAYSRAYKTECISEINGHLFTGIKTLGVMTASNVFAERYLLALNFDGSVIAGKYTLSKTNDLEGFVGYARWIGDAARVINWVSVAGSRLLFTSRYNPNNITPVQLVELLDDSLYLDAGFFPNNPPIALQQVIAAGANFGDMAAGGGLAAAFDGNRAKTQAASAFANASFGYVGRAFAVPQVVGQVLVWPSIDQGWTIGGAGNVTLELYVKNGLPANSQDGILVASKSMGEAALPIPSSLIAIYDVATFSHAWVRVSRAGATQAILAQVLFQTGPLHWLAGATVNLMDGPLHTRSMGVYTVDANGNIVPQGLGGEDLTRTDLVTGLEWRATLEPFCPPVPGGQDVGQRIKKRRIRKAQVYASNSTGFLMQSLYSDQSAPTLPPYGTPMSEHRVDTYHQGEDTTQPPLLREESYHQRPLGRSHDPRWRIVKDTPGPVTIEEVAIEVTV